MPAKSNEYISESESDAEEVAYQPPRHFNPVSGKEKLGSVTGKEVWLIKVPKGFPINKVKSLPILFTAQSIKDGPKPFTIKDSKDDVSYQVNEELLALDASDRKYVVLSRKSKAYKPMSDAPITRFYNVSEKVLVPEINLGTAIKPRQNVKEIAGLRMRHFPTGYDANDYTEAKKTHSTSHTTARDDDGKSTKKSKSEKKEKKEKKDKSMKKEKKEKRDK